MRRILPIVFIFLLCLQCTPSLALAVTPLPVASPAVQPTLPAYQPNPAPVIPDNTWIIDPEVTFAGKNAARAGELLNWTLLDYKWSTVQRNQQNPIIPFWVLIRNIIYVLLVFFVLATAFVLIATRGKSLSIQKFIPRFIWVVLLITFSFSAVGFIYGGFDAVQGFFLRSDINKACPPTCISNADLLFVGWDYRPFFGLRLTGDQNTESAFISLLFVKLTALTYYAMVIILIVRKVVLWFFIIVSPVFPLLLFYYPLRNTAKVWLGEFFRWLLYGPLFAIFLAGLVSLWRRGIPMLFDFSKANNASDVIFPTAINILLGGPGQLVTLNNSINYKDTFALYLVSLIMLWMVILVPWILLRIFLDRAMSLLTTDNSIFQQMMNLLVNRNTPPSPSSPGPLPDGQPAGAALQLPYKRYTLPDIPRKTGEALSIPNAGVLTEAQIAKPLSQSLANTEILKMTNLSIPTIRDIARYETMHQMKDSQQQTTTIQTKDTLRQIANPSIVINTVDKQRFSEIREKLIQNSQNGNDVATSILRASQVVSQMESMQNQQMNTQLKNTLVRIANRTTSASETGRISELKQNILQESQRGSSIANTILKVNEKTSMVDIQHLRDEVVRAAQKGDSVSTSILAEVVDNVEAAKLQETIIRMSHPETTTVNERPAYQQLHDTLVEEKDKGSDVAAKFLAVDEKTSLEQIQKLQDQLDKGTIHGDRLSAAVSALTMGQDQVIKIKDALITIANPSIIQQPADKEQFSIIHDTLLQASQHGNAFAGNLLSVGESSSPDEIEKVKETLIHDTLQGDTVAAQVLSMIVNTVDAKTMQQVLEQLANPTIILHAGKHDIYAKAKQKLDLAKQEGNSIATEVVNRMQTKGPLRDLLSLKEFLLQAKEKSDPLAVALLELLTGEKGIQVGIPLVVTMPETNRIQAVSLEDYEAVKKIWQENYKNLDLPQGVANRKEWITQDINQIDEIINLLASGDQEKMEKGMQQVSNILPFLLLGGFSINEIITYLKAKQEAGKSTLEGLTQEEDTFVDIERKTSNRRAVGTQAQTMAATSQTSSAYDEREEALSPLQEIATHNRTFTLQSITEQNIPLPTLRDIADIEEKTMTNKTSEVTKVTEMLWKFAHPEDVSSIDEQKQIQQVRTELLHRSQQKDVQASAVINAINHVADETQGLPIQSISLQNILLQFAIPQILQDQSMQDKMRDIKGKVVFAQQQGSSLASSVLTKIDSMYQSTAFNIQDIVQAVANPTYTSSLVEKERIMQLHETLEKESRTGNTLASAILALNPTTSKEEIVSVSNRILQEQSNPLTEQFVALTANSLDMKAIKQVRDLIQEAKQKGDPLGTILANAFFDNYILPVESNKTDNKTNFPSINRLQTVSIEDYEAVKQMWQENYKTMDVPNGISNRAEWIQKDITTIEDIINNLSSGDQIKIKEGMQQVGSTLPFLLLGGFSLDETIAYLKAKQEAGRSAFAIIAESEKDSIYVTNSQESNMQTNTVQTISSVQQIAPKFVSQPNSELMQLINISIPSVQDLVRFEIGLQSQSDPIDIMRTKDLLYHIAQPAKISEVQQREKLETIREAILQFSNKGDQFASSMVEAMNVVSNSAPIQLIQQTKQTFQEIANPALVAKPEIKEQRIILHDQLVTEGQNGNNQIARSILSINEKATISEVQNIREKLIDASFHGDKLATTILGATIGEQKIEGLQDVIEGIAHPDHISDTQSRERVVIIKDKLIEAKEKGDNIATAILDLSNKVAQKATDSRTIPHQALANIYKQLIIAKDKGEQVAIMLLLLLDEPFASRNKRFALPKINRIQAVSLDDYEAVKKMWEEYYEKGDPPHGMIREEWVNGDIKKIIEVLGLLQQSDEDKVNEGMHHVADILPFILLGGFTLEETQAYLRAKLEAARTVLKMLGLSPEELVEVGNSEDKKIPKVQEK